MPLLLAIGAFLLMQIINVALSFDEKKWREHKSTPEENVKSLREAYGDDWMFTHSSMVNPEIREKSYDIWARATYGENYKDHIAFQWNASKAVRIKKQAWDEYYSKLYGDDYYIKYPHLKWPEGTDDLGLTPSQRAEVEKKPWFNGV